MLLMPGPSNQLTEHKEITVPDPYESIALFFTLLESPPYLGQQATPYDYPNEKIPSPQACCDLTALGDKYDVPYITHILIASLKALTSVRAYDTLPLAIALGNEEMIRISINFISQPGSQGFGLEHPSRWSYDEVQRIGFPAWHELCQASLRCGLVKMDEEFTVSHWAAVSHAFSM